MNVPPVRKSSTRVLPPVPERLVARAMSILRDRYRFQAGQRALIVHDNPKALIAACFVVAAQRLNGKVEVIGLNDKRFAEDRLKKILAYIQEPKNKADLLINLFESRPEETPSRVQVIGAEETTQAPVMHSPGINEEMLALELDFPQLRKDAERLKEIFKGAGQVRITSPAGTDITISLAGREGLDDIAPFAEGGELVSNYPCGEAFWAPVETAGQGKIIVDGTISVFGDPGTPLKIEVVEGRVTRINWLNPQAGSKDLLAKIIEAISKDKLASTLGELGIGLVPFPLDGENRQRFMPFMLASEKARKTAHIAFGHNLDMHGENSSKTHNDFLMLEPTISLTYVDGRPPRLVMSAGELLFAA